MSEFKWKGHGWRVGHPWGITHPKKKNSWFGDDAVTVDENDVLNLSVLYNPKTFDDDVQKPYSVGLVSCTEKLGYGRYTWKAQLPYGANLWPSLWTCGWDSWPPEIDMIEAYTYKGDMDYIHNCLTTNIKTNVHYGTEDNHKQVGGKGIATLIYKMFGKKDGINEYSFEWTEKHIKFYFNGIKVRTIKDKKVLADFNKCGYIYPIMNLEINNDFELNDIYYRPVFKIYDFKYTQIITID